MRTVAKSALELGKQLEALARDIDAAPVWGKPAAVEQLGEAIIQHMVDHEQRLFDLEQGFAEVISSLARAAAQANGGQPPLRALEGGKGEGDGLA